MYIYITIHKSHNVYIVYIYTHIYIQYMYVQIHTYLYICIQVHKCSSCCTARSVVIFLWIYSFKVSFTIPQSFIQPIKTHGRPKLMQGLNIQLVFNWHHHVCGVSYVVQRDSKTVGGTELKRVERRWMEIKHFKVESHKPPKETIHRHTHKYAHCACVHKAWACEQVHMSTVMSRVTSTKTNRFLRPLLGLHRARDQHSSSVRVFYCVTQSPGSDTTRSVLHFLKWGVLK